MVRQVLGTPHALRLHEIQQSLLLTLGTWQLASLLTGARVHQFAKFPHLYQSHQGGSLVVWPKY